MKTAILGAAEGDILIDGDVIAKTGGFEISAGATTIDARGLHVMPGIVDLGVFSVDRRA